MWEVWLHIEANEEDVRQQWEMTRAIAYNIGRFGNSDPKKFPKKIERFWPFPWEGRVNPKDPKEIFRRHAELQAQFNINQKKNEG